MFESDIIVMCTGELDWTASLSLRPFLFYLLLCLSVDLIAVCNNFHNSLKKIINLLRYFSQNVFDLLFISYTLIHQLILRDKHGYIFSKLASENLRA